MELADCTTGPGDRSRHPRADWLVAAAVVVGGRRSWAVRPCTANYAGAGTALADVS